MVLDHISNEYPLKKTDRVLANFEVQEAKSKKSNKKPESFLMFNVSSLF